MTQEHPITPPQCLINRWWEDAPEDDELEFTKYIAIKAAQWGSNQELEACCADLRMVLGPDQADWLRSVRRPKPPSLKEQALAALAAADGADHPVVATVLTADQHAIICRALEALPE